MYRRRSPGLEVFLVHPGGPFFAKKDHGTWTIPKGEYLDGELPLEAAKREFQEETGFPVPETYLDLGSIKQAGGKIVSAIPVTMTVSGETKPGALRGKINGGGPRLNLRTSSGDIRVNESAARTE